jgi:hypothetical protein
MSLIELDRDLKEAGVSSQYDRVVLLIAEAIRCGTLKGSTIVRTIADLGYNRRYVGMQLSKNEGADPERHHWFKGSDGHYHLHL